MTFMGNEKYQRYSEMTIILQNLADKYPQYVQLSSIGKSYEGRDIWLAAVTNFSTGSDLEKPAIWLDGTLHSPEIAPTNVCLHMIDYLTENYGNEPDVTYAMDTRTFYICPRVSPDGVEYFLADNPKLVYSSARKYPADENVSGGLIPQDIDGDGRMLMMRIPDPHGSWKICDEEPRLMVRRNPDERGGKYYRLIREGIFENYDNLQLKIKKSETTLDLNRNFPSYWRPENEQPGAGDYPTSEPEVRSLVEFFRSHPNITSSISLHTYSGAILRPYSDRSDDSFPPQDLHIYKSISKKASDITGYAALSTYHDGLLNKALYSTGTFDGWLYDYHGIFGWTVDIWDPHRQAGINDANIGKWENEHTLEDDKKLLAWSDANMEGNGYVDWYEYDHPQLGKIELGGWNKRETFTNPPLKFLQKEIEKFPPWIIWQALITPRLEPAGVETESLGDDFYKVRLAVLNSGWLPTYVAKKAIERKAAKGTRCEINLADDMVLIAGPIEQNIGELEGRVGAWATIPGWPGGEPTDHIAVAEWIVHAPKGGKIDFTVRNNRAGCFEASVSLGD